MKIKKFENPRIYSKLVHILSENEPPIEISDSDQKLNLSTATIKTMKRLKNLIIETQNSKDQDEIDNSNS